MSKLDEYMNELGQNTSGGSHDAVVFAGKGLELLKNLAGFSKSKGKAKEDETEEEEEDPEDPSDTTGEGMEKNANGGDLEEIDEEEEEDPAENGDGIFTNHGKKLPKSSLRQAVAKNYQEEEHRFAKSMNEFLDEHEEVLDATPAIKDLAKSLRSLGKSQTAGLESVMEANRVLAKGLQSALQAIAGLAEDMEAIKRQPATAPATGVFAVPMVKNAGQKGATTRRLSKSEVEDILSDAMNEGLVEPMTLAKAAFISDQADMDHFISTLPEEVQERFN